MDRFAFNFHLKVVAVWKKKTALFAWRPALFVAISWDAVATRIWKITSVFTLGITGEYSVYELHTTLHDCISNPSSANRGCSIGYYSATYTRFALYAALLKQSYAYIASNRKVSFEQHQVPDDNSWEDANVLYIYNWSLWKTLSVAKGFALCRTTGQSVSNNLPIPARRKLP